MLLFFVLSFFKKGDTIQGGTLFKEIWYVKINQNNKNSLAIRKYNGDTILYQMDFPQCRNYKKKSKFGLSLPYEIFRQ